MSEVALQKKMRLRLLALMRKADIKENDPDALSLLDFLSTHLKTKRDYEDALGSEESADLFVKKHKLVGNQMNHFMAIQNAKDIFTPNPILDWILTIAFIIELGMIGYEMYQHGLFIFFLLLCLLVDAVVHRVKDVSAIVGTYLSNAAVKYDLVDSFPLSGKIQMKKWQEQSWQLFIHVTVSIVEYYILSDEPWWDDTRTIWMPHPYEQRNFFRNDLQMLYIIQLAIWVYTCFVHRFVDERRKDYFVMYTHHIFTIALVGTSWALGYMRVGLLVLWIHDASDIFVDLLKLSNYLKIEDKRGFFASEIAYVMCVVSWIYFRLFLFPFKVIHAALMIPFQMLVRLPRNPTVIFGLFEVFPADLPYHTEMCVLLMALLALHIYWFHLFIMVGYRILTESVREASRQEYEGDSDEDSSDVVEAKN